MSAGALRYRVFERWINSGTDETLDEWRSRKRMTSMHGDIVIYGNVVTNNFAQRGVLICGNEYRGVRGPAQP